MPSRLILFALVVCSAAVGGMVGFWIGPGLCEHFDWDVIAWGDVGTWVGGLATAIAVGVAALELSASRRAEVAAEAKLQRAHAMSVSITEIRLVKGGSGDVIRAVVENGGGLPVFDTQVDLLHSGQLLINARVGVLGIGGKRAIEMRPPRMVDVDDVSWEMRFRDSYGTIWRSSAGSVEHWTASST